MGTTTQHKTSIWEVVRAQHGVVSRRQLLDSGLSVQGIRHRISTGRLHRVRRGVYAVGRPELSREGRWSAALLAMGRAAALSHRSAAALWGIEREGSMIDVTVPTDRHSPGVRTHRRNLPPEELRAKQNLRLTSPATTLIDLATCISSSRLERAVNEADKLDLVDPEELRAAAERAGGRRGARAVRTLIDSKTFRLTDSVLERRFLRLVASARLPLPLTQQMLCGYRVDFYWPEAKLVVETDGLTYHRTAAQQARDSARDQALTAAGFTPLRIPHAQLRDHPAQVVRLLTQLIPAAA
jgi:very-short-patch-repair endonuclease